jgi:hypothetical protein
MRSRSSTAFITADERPVTEVVVDVFIAIDIVDMAAVAVPHEQRVRGIIAVVAGHAERHAFHGTLVRIVRFGRAFFVSLDFLF